MRFLTIAPEVDQNNSATHAAYLLRGSPRLTRSRIYVKLNSFWKATVRMIAHLSMNGFSGTS
jgi:hypothetical protein